MTSDQIADESLNINYPEDLHNSFSNNNFSNKISASKILRNKDSIASEEKNILVNDKTKKQLQNVSNTSCTENNKELTQFSGIKNSIENNDKNKITIKENNDNSREKEKEIKIDEIFHRLAKKIKEKKQNNIKPIKITDIYLNNLINKAHWRSHKVLINRYDLEQNNIGFSKDDFYKNDFKEKTSNIQILSKNTFNKLNNRKIKKASNKRHKNCNIFNIINDKYTKKNEKENISLKNIFSKTNCEINCLNDENKDNEIIHDKNELIKIVTKKKKEAPFKTFIKKIYDNPKIREKDKLNLQENKLQIIKSENIKFSIKPSISESVTNNDEGKSAEINNTSYYNSEVLTSKDQSDGDYKSDTKNEDYTSLKNNSMNNQKILKISKEDQNFLKKKRKTDKKDLIVNKKYDLNKDNNNLNDYLISKVSTIEDENLQKIFRKCLSKTVLKKNNLGFSVIYVNNNIHVANNSNKVFQDFEYKRINSKNHNDKIESINHSTYDYTKNNLKDINSNNFNINNFYNSNYKVESNFNVNVNVVNFPGYYNNSDSNNYNISNENNSSLNSKNNFDYFPESNKNNSSKLSSRDYKAENISTFPNINLNNPIPKFKEIPQMNFNNSNLIDEQSFHFSQGSVNSISNNKDHQNLDNILKRKKSMMENKLIERETNNDNFIKINKIGKEQNLVNIQLLKKLLKKNKITFQETHQELNYILKFCLNQNSSIYEITIDNNNCGIINFICYDIQTGDKVIEIKNINNDTNEMIQFNFKKLIKLLELK